MITIFGLATASVWAAGTTTWEMTTWQDFLRGRLANVSLSRDGQLRPAAPWKVAFEDGQSSVWSAVQAPDGTLYLGTGHKGRVVRISPDGQATTIFTAPEPEVFALALDSQGVLYAGTSPDGKIYRIENGRGTEYFDPKERYIWSLAMGSKPGALYAGTGERGKVFQITGAGQGELYFDSGQSHITALTIDTDQTLLAGSDPNGILYRIRAKDSAFVLYDAPLPEIRSIVLGPEGRIYVGALGGSVAKRAGAAGSAGSASGLTVVTAPMTITVEAQAGMELKPKAESPKPAAAAPSTVTPQIEISGVEKSAIYRLNSDNTVETLWSSKDENAYDLLLTGGAITFSTDSTGRVYSVTDDRKVTLLDQTNRGDLVRLVKLRTGLAAISSTPGLVLTQGEGAA
ncbi:MAG: WD40 repeat domain-containing protein, partial [Acidobacteria bacterium]|nr:WD40 repeat domain-containing protein [Acidobacteriota bacterium]